MSYSPLATEVNISGNRTHPRRDTISLITIHCFVGQVTAARGCQVFLPESRQASCNYVVGFDGSIGVSVDEGDRSWCSGGSLKVNGISGSVNDHSAITIEVASETVHPYKVTAKAYAALVDLVTDICKRNGFKQLMWAGDKTLVGKPELQNMTVHRWFANKACPGDYLYNLHGQIAAEVNKRLSEGNPDTGNENHANDPDYIDMEDMNMNKDELKTLIKECVREVYDEINPIYPDLKDVPYYWQGVAKALLDSDAVNGGTPKEVCATDLNLRKETLKAAVIAVQYHNAQEAKLTPEDFDHE